MFTRPSKLKKIMETLEIKNIIMNKNYFYLKK